MQQLCSNSNFHEMICTTSVSEAMFCMPTKNFKEFYANLAIISDLLHNCNLIAANLQQFCCSVIFFWKREVTTCSKIVLQTFPVSLVWFYPKMPLKGVFLWLMWVCCRFAAFCSNLGIFWKRARSGFVHNAKLYHFPHLQQLLHICTDSLKFGANTPDYFL